MRARFSQGMAGGGAVIEAVAAITHTKVFRFKARRCAFEAGNWLLDRDGSLTSPVFGMEGGGPLYHAALMRELGERGFAAEGVLAVTIFPDVFDPGLLHGIDTLLSGRAALIRRALGVEREPSVRLAEGGVLEEYGLAGGFVFPFFPASATYPGILSALQFSERMVAHAASGAWASPPERPIEHEKTAMRRFLLQINMTGRQYAVARRELLSRLPGAPPSRPRKGRRPTFPRDAPSGSAPEDDQAETK